MEADDRCLREYVDGLVTRCPDLGPIADQLYVDMLRTRSGISQRKMLYTLHCGADEPEGCCLRAQLTVWNEFLWSIGMEIRETRPGRFALGRLSSRYVPMSTRTWRRHVGVLVHWLLTRHRCVESMELCQSRIRRKHFLFSDGLRLSRGLRRVKLCDYSVEDRWPRHLIAALTSTIATLDTLEIVSVRFSTASVSILCDFLVRSEVLSTLVFLENWLDPPKAEALAKSMAHCSSLRKVHVDELFLTGEPCCARGCLVLISAHLEELIVSRSLVRDETGYSNIFGPLFRSLAEPGTQLERLTISSFVLGQPDLDDLAAALGCNRQLKCLRLLCSGAFWRVCLSLDQVLMHNVSLTDICVNSSLVNTSSFKGLARAIEGNATLKNLAFDDARLAADEAMVLLDALTMNTTLEKCHLGKICQPGLLQFLKAIRYKDLTARLDFAAVYATTADLITSLTSGCQTASMCFEPEDTIESPELERLSNAFCDNGFFLRSLTVRLRAIDCKLALTLSTVISSCRYLRKVCLDFPAKAPEVDVLRQGLGKARSLDELTIRGWTFDCFETVAFSAMLRTLSLTNVTFEALTKESSFSLVMKLRRELVLNYTLLEAKIYVHPQKEEGDFEILEYLRRNQSLLFQAARFVVPPASTAKNAAAAFEKVQGSHALVAEVSRLAGLSEAEAAEMVTCRRRYLDVNYLAIVGVVKEKVECDRTEGGDSAVHIDQMPLDCWLRIRRYLSVEDILDDALSVMWKLKI